MSLNPKQLPPDSTTSMIKPLRTPAVILLSGITLFACGGGADDNTSPPSETLTTIDGGNALTVMREALATVLGSEQLSGFVDLNGAQETRFGNAKTALSRSVVIEQTVLQCIASGSKTVWGSLADLDTYTVGDITNIDSDRCDNGRGEVIDGLVNTTYTNLEKISAEQSLLAVKQIFTDFKVTKNNESTSWNGDIEIAIDTRVTLLKKINFSGERFTSNVMGKIQEIREFSNNYEEYTSEQPVSWLRNAQGSLSSSEFSFNVHYATSVPFAGNAESYPYTGGLLVTGANNATLQLITLDDINIRIDADYNGDGNVEESFNLSWAELRL